MKKTASSFLFQQEIFNNLLLALRLLLLKKTEANKPVSLCKTY